MKQNSNNSPFRETFQPLLHVAPDSLKNKILFTLRLFFDFQVATVFRDARKEFKNIKNNVLEIGCGLQPYRHLIPAGVKYYGIEWNNAGHLFQYKSKDVIYYDGGNFPFRNEVFNFIFHTEVLEHIYDLKQFLSECSRVLQKNGKMFFTIPFAARYHYIPYDYWRLTPASIEKLLKDAGFRNIIVANRGSDITALIFKLNTILYRIIFKKYNDFILKIIHMGIFGILFIIPITFLIICGHLSVLLKIGSPDDPLGYSVYCGK